MDTRIVAEIEIDAELDRVFLALTTPAELAVWWGDPDGSVATHWEMPLVIGARWRSQWRDADGREFAIGGVIIDVSPPHLLIYSWRDERYPTQPHTQVRFDLEQRTRRVHVRVTHSGFDEPRPDFNDYKYGGWWRVLARLRAYTST